jgi:hypothetical protein
VIGIGVKNSTSDLLIGNCDEFIFYEDLIAEIALPRPSAAKRRSSRKASAKAPLGKSVPKLESQQADRLQEGINLVVEVAEALYAERGYGAKLWGSMVKQTLQRRRPDFNEAAYGCRSFNDLLEEAAERGQLELERDEKSGGYIIRRIDRRS